MKSYIRRYFAPRKFMPPLRLHRKLMIQLIRTKNNLIFGALFRKKLIYQTTVGATGMPGSRRLSRASIEVAIKKFIGKMVRKGFRSASIRFIGAPDRNTKAIMKTLGRSTFRITYFHYRIPIAHNGIKLKKMRRT